LLVAVLFLSLFCGNILSFEIGLTTITLQILPIN
jgi:hypothetical protein